MRGKARIIRRRICCQGITPAHAGKSVFRSSLALVCKDHPLACGEKISLPLHFLLVLGSPPRMRGKGQPAFGGQTDCGITPAHAGKRRRIAPSPLFFRITPAHAGKSCWIRLCSGIAWDHPRACGEKICHHIGGILEKGSPPRMRGKVSQAILQALEHGITPAHAGKSSLS